MMSGLFGDMPIGYLAEWQSNTAHMVLPPPPFLPLPTSSLGGGAGWGGGVECPGEKYGVA